MPYKDPQKRREATKKWALSKGNEYFNLKKRELYAKNPEKYRDKAKNWRNLNKDKALEIQRTSHMKNRMKNKIKGKEWRLKQLALNPAYLRAKLERLKQLQLSQYPKNDAKNLTDAYIKRILKKQEVISPSIELIELNRDVIKLKRSLKQLKLKCDGTN